MTTSEQLTIGSSKVILDCFKINQELLSVHIINLNKIISYTIFLLNNQLNQNFYVTILICASIAEKSYFNCFYWSFYNRIPYNLNEIISKMQTDAFATAICSSGYPIGSENVPARTAVLLRDFRGFLENPNLSNILESGDGV